MAQGDQLYELVNQALADSKTFFPEHQPDLGFLALALAGEAGEFCNVLKKILRGSLDGNDSEIATELRMELVDVFIYVLLLAGALGLDLAQAYEYKRDFNKSRFIIKGVDGG